MRDCVCSTVPLSVSTFELTVLTSVRTNFFVAQAGAMATVRDSNDAARRLLRICDFLLNDDTQRAAAMYPPRACTTRFFFCVRISSGCQPGAVPGSEGMRYWYRNSLDRSSTAAAVCSGMLQIRMSPPVQRARSESEATLLCSPAASLTEYSAAGRPG